MLNEVEKEGRVVKALGSFTIMDEEDVDVLQRSLEMFYVTGKKVRYTITEVE